MKRLITSLMMDFRLQFRYGFYYAGAFITAVWVAILFLIPDTFLQVAIPLIIFTDLAIVGFFFIAGQLIFEKTEATIFALVCTPQTFLEYVGAKMISLTFLAVVISLVVAVISIGTDINFLLLIIAVVLTSLISLLTGLIAVLPYQSISPFILPAQLYILLLGLPIFYFVGWLENPIFYLLPTQGSILLLNGVFQNIKMWQIVYSLGYQFLWIIILFHIAKKRFQSYVVAQRGGGL